MDSIRQNYLNVHYIAVLFMYTVYGGLYIQYKVLVMDTVYHTIIYVYSIAELFTCTVLQRYLHIWLMVQFMCIF